MFSQLYPAELQFNNAIVLQMAFCLDLELCMINWTWSSTKLWNSKIGHFPVVVFFFVPRSILGDSLFIVVSIGVLNLVFVLLFPILASSGWARERAGCYCLICPRREKTCLRGLRTTKAQSSLRIRTVWSAHLLFALEIIISKIVTSELSIL